GRSTCCGSTGSRSRRPPTRCSSTRPSPASPSTRSSPPSPIVSSTRSTSRSASPIATTTRDPIGARRGGSPTASMSLEPADLTRLYERTARPLLVFFQRRVDDPEVALDLMSDCFTIALERRHQFRGEGDDALSGWLWSIAQSVLREYERRDESARRWARRLGR